MAFIFSKSAIYSFEVGRWVFIETAGKSAGKPNFPGSVVDVNLDETVESKMSNVEDAFLKQAILIIQQT